MSASAAGAAQSSSFSVGLESFVLCIVRCAFFLCCRHYVNASLFSGLKSVIRQDNPSTSLDSPDPDSFQLDAFEAGLSINSTKSTPSSSLLPPEHGGPRRVLSPSPSVLSGVYTKLSTGLFCLAFSESCTLFTLLLFGDVVSDR